MSNLDVYERCAEKLESQRRYCTANEKPIFADGLFCPFCNRLIYNRISREQAANQLITACPECHKSLCD